MHKNKNCCFSCISNQISIDMTACRDRGLLFCPLYIVEWIPWGRWYVKSTLGMQLRRRRHNIPHHGSTPRRWWWAATQGEGRTPERCGCRKHCHAGKAGRGTSGSFKFVCHFGDEGGRGFLSFSAVIVIKLSLLFSLL